ncbi:MAG: Ig-like domain-containing protein [Gemmatimonadota bacterium]
MIDSLRRLLHRGACFAFLTGLVACASSDASAPPCAVTSISVSVLPAPLRVGGTATLAAVVNSQRCSTAQLVVRWISSAPLVVSVSPSGVLSAEAPGRATIRATAGGASADVDVVVESPVATVEVLPASTIVVQGATVQLTATTRDAQGNVLVGREMAWQSQSPASATVSPAGLVTGVAPDPAVAIVAVSEGRSGTTVVRVVPPPRLVLDSTQVAFAAVAGSPSPAARSIPIRNGGGGELRGLALGPVRHDAGAGGWLQPSLSSASATPTAALLMRVTTSALPAGHYSATISVSAAAEDSPQDVTVTLDVRAAPVGSVVVSPGTLLLALGVKQQMTATIRDADGAILTGRRIRWSSTNPTVAAIDSVTGLLTAASIGVATLRASVDGATGVGFVYTGSPSAGDGSWRGQAGSGRTFAMTIALGRVTSLVIGVGSPLGSPCALSYSASPLTLIGHNAFSFVTSGSSSNATVAGTLLSSASAQGTYGTISFDRYLCPPNLLVSGSVPGGSWTAAKQ